MKQELNAYNEDGTQQFTSLLEKQHRELSQIDSESTNLGISVADLAESMQDIDVFTTNTAVNTSTNNNRASMTSLYRSYISNSFISNATNSDHGTTTHK